MSFEEEKADGNRQGCDTPIGIVEAGVPVKAADREYQQGGSNVPCEHAEECWFPDEGCNAAPDEQCEDIGDDDGAEAGDASPLVNAGKMP